MQIICSSCSWQAANLVLDCNGSAQIEAAAELLKNVLIQAEL